jgi:hypothetical protein
MTRSNFVRRQLHPLLQIHMVKAVAMKGGSPRNKGAILSNTKPEWLGLIAAEAQNGILC